MKLSKILSILVFLTGFSLLYVYQQTEIFRLAYVGQKKLVCFQDLLDKNTILRYNLEKNISLAHLGNNFLECADFQMPATYRLVRLEGQVKNLRLTKQASKRESFLARLFSVKRQAQAQTINR